MAASNFRSRSRRTGPKLNIKNIIKSFLSFWSFKYIKNPRLLIFLSYFSSFILAGIVILLFVVLAIFAYFSRDLPNPNKLLERDFELSTRFFDRNGKLLYEAYGDKNRTLINLPDVSPDVVHATLATEDAEFYLHQGFSFRGMARALKNMITGGSLQSGSTLTQQVIKNSILTQEQTVSRKIKEFILSLQLENKYPKDQIIQMYLNETPYGGQNYGIFSAAKTYFNKSPKDLTLAESAYLAGLPQRPSYYSNFGVNPQAGLDRKNYVLYLMHDKGWIGSDGKRYYINDKDYNDAKNQSLKFQTVSTPLVAPHFVLYTKQFLVDMFGEDMVDRGGLQVTTSLDLDLQTHAEQIVSEEVDKAHALNVWNGALIALDPKTAQILAMVGSKGYYLAPQPDGCTSGTTDANSCKFDPFVNVTTSPRQPGSSIKPITYATMLMQGYTAATPLLDVPTRFQGATADQPYVPVNYDGKFRGVVSVRHALGSSLNIPAVKVLKIVGIDNMINTAQKMGITTFTDRSRYGLSLTLGGGETKLLEMSGAYNVFAAQGIFRKPTPIVQVKDSKGNVIYDSKDNTATQVISPEVSFLISDILSDDGARADAFGLGSLLNISGHQVAVKTGTTDDKRDNYAIGYTPSILSAVWVGNSNNDKMDPNVASGITGATPIWHRFMADYLKDKQNEKFVPPSNVKKVDVDKLTGMLPATSDSKDVRSEWFIQGTEPTAKSDWYQKIEVCKLDGRIANQDCKDASETDINNYIKITAELPEWQYAVDDWVKQHYKDSLYFPPEMVSKLQFDSSGDVTNQNDVYVQIDDLKDGSNVFLNFRINVEVSSNDPVSVVRFYMDGNEVGDDKSAPYGHDFSLSSKDIGTHDFDITVTDKSGNKGSAKIGLNVVGYTTN